MHEDQNIVRIKKNKMNSYKRIQFLNCNLSLLRRRHGNEGKPPALSILLLNYLNDKKSLSREHFTTHSDNNFNFANLHIMRVAELTE